MPRHRRLRRVLLVVVAILVGLPILAAVTATLAVRGSLARLDGRRSIIGLQAPVSVIRDSLGVPDIVAASREDAARALGYLHAQDRFFQMDLQRRLAAGELAALLGSGALETDRDNRRHRFRARAQAVVAAMTGRERTLLFAYTDGVNAGLDDLRARPWEYLLLRAKPRPWLAEDTVLTVHAMFLDLSLPSVTSELTWASVRDNLPEALATFLLPVANRWDAPLQPDGLTDAAGSRFDARGRAHVGLRRSHLAELPRPGVRRDHRQQQLGGGRPAHPPWRRSARQRHASRPRPAQHLVSRPAELARSRGTTSGHGRHLAGHARRRRRQQRRRRLGLHQQPTATGRTS